MPYGRRHNPPRVKPEILRNFISTYLQTRTSKEESISYLIQHIREVGNMYIPTNVNFAESELERMGFTFRKEYNQYGATLRTYVNLPK
jgi:hypothetical protein